MKPTPSNRPSVQRLILCILCKEDTSFLGTQLCDRCWELGRRIELNIELAKIILDRIKNNRDWRTGE